jgi:hypothetical protein
MSGVQLVPGAWRDTSKPRAACTPTIVYGYGVDRDDAPDHRSIAAEPPHPQCVGQHDLALTAEREVLGGERAADRGVDAEHAKEVLGDHLANRDFRITAAG